MTDSTSLDRLRTQVEYPESWRPEPGDTLVGTAVAWSTFEKTDPATQETKECQILAGPRAASMPGLVGVGSGTPGNVACLGDTAWGERATTKLPLNSRLGRFFAGLTAGTAQLSPFGQELES